MNIIYHSRDLDGYCSAAICKKKYPEAKLIGFDYGQGLEKLLEAIPSNEPIIMVDVSLPMPHMETLAIYSNFDLTWIDHHASAIKDYEEYMQGREMFLTPVLEDGIAACEIAWKHLFPDDPMPEAVELLGKYDTWRNQDPEEWNESILPFQYGMRLNVKNAETFPQHLLEEHTVSDCASIMQIGDIVLLYQRQQDERVMKGAFEVDFKGYKAIACNGTGFNSQAFDSVWDELKYDLMMPFRFDGKKWTFSLYTTKEIDCSELAKSMGGGGHVKAAGFSLEDIPEFLLPKYQTAFGLLMETTRNLGHPAYGISSGTTLAIDELREKAFDFLGVPKE